LLKYDTYLRESLVDHLSAAPLTPQDMLSGDPPSDRGFRTGDTMQSRHRSHARRASKSARKSEKTVAVDLIAAARGKALKFRSSSA